MGVLLRGGATIELGAEICGYRVEDNEAYAVACEEDGELVGDNVFLCFEVAAVVVVYSIAVGGKGIEGCGHVFGGDIGWWRGGES